jgi:hypothetical protein
MKVFSLLLFAALFASPALAQLTQPADSIPDLLCKKWAISYTELNGVKITPQPGGPRMTFEFRKDRSVIIAYGNDKPVTGAWAFDAAKKRVRITLNGRNRSSVIKLQPDELVMQSDVARATPDDPAPIITVYRLAQ